jgi:hypothetical protein
MWDEGGIFTASFPKTSNIVAVSEANIRPRYMILWFSSAGFEGNASRILALSCLIVVDTGRFWKLRGSELGDTICKVKVGPLASPSPDGAPEPAEGAAEVDMALLKLLLFQVDLLIIFTREGLTG